MHAVPLCSLLVERNVLSEVSSLRILLSQKHLTLLNIPRGVRSEMYNRPLMICYDLCNHLRMVLVMD